MCIKSVVFLLFINEFNRYVCFVWDKMPCSADEEQTMPEGIEKDTGRFPWLGVIQHSFDVGDKRNYAITGAVLIHPIFAIAAAEDVSKINHAMLVNNTELIFWKDAKQKYALPVKDYILHPEFTEGITSATLALVSIVSPMEADFSDIMAPVRAVCMPMAGIGAYIDMYAVKLTDVTGDIQKEVAKMNLVDKKECDEFYYQSQLHYDKMNPTNPLCATSTNSTVACIWDSGTALITRQSWGFWQLIGFAVRGPGCGAPTKFLSIVDYMPWMNDVIRSIASADIDDDSEGDLALGLRRLSPTRLVFYPASAFLPRYLGECDPLQRGRTLYRDTGLFIGNKDYVQGYYLASITQHASFHCGEVNLRVARRTNAVMWVEHHCHRAMEGRTLGQSRTGDLERLECFNYFRSTAYIEFKFTFSFRAEFTIAIYGKLDYRPDAYPFMWSQHTTGWWPTWGKVKMTVFHPEYSPVWDMR